MERKCSCGNFFDVRECNGICPECNKDIFNQSTQDNNVSKKPNNLNMSKQEPIKKCTGCDRLSTDELGLNKYGEPYLACCPDNNYKPITALELFYNQILSGKITDTLANIDYYLELERKQIIDAYEDDNTSYYPNSERSIKANEYYNDKYGK